MNEFFKERLDNYANLLTVLFSGMDTIMSENGNEYLQKQTFATFDILLGEIMSIIKDAELHENMGK